MPGRTGPGAMNLGDGLKLETQILNGKTKLILAPYAVQEKGSKQAGNRGRTHKSMLKIKNPTQVLHSVQSNNAKPEQPVLKPRSGIGGVVSRISPANVLKELENKHHNPITQQNVQQTKTDAGKAKPMPKKASNGPKQRLQQKPAISADELRESLVCLTQEQFQQILMTINQGGKPVAQDQTSDKDLDKQEVEAIDTQSPVTKEEDANCAISEEANDLRTAEKAKDEQAGSLIGTLGERERDKSLQEAKKVQWRRELDEQVALKKKLKEADKDGINLRHREVHSRESCSSERTPFSDLSKNTPLNYGSPDQDGSLFKTPTVTETTDSSPVEGASNFSSPELPAAIRSAFVIGEAAPLDHPFSAVKRQQQKKWLEELNKQREETAQRKMQEKQKFQETVKQDHWAMHFDSFKKQTDHQSPVYQHRFQQYDNTVSTSDPAPVEPATSPASNFHQERPETLKSTEEGHFQSQKSGFLRTMTSLLDPVQIEERDKKRLKQLEHQKAIAAQVEQKRQRKQLEDEQRKQEEQEEERRLTREREEMQKQYEEDTFRQKHKEEVLNLKTRELYQSMQRAQEEAQRLKQEQRMRHLLQKGHDISNLQRNLAGDAVNLVSSRSAGIVSDEYQSATNSVMQQSVTALPSPRKDTAVQTDDLDVLRKSDFISNAKGTTWRHEQNASPDIPIEFHDQQPTAELQTKKTKSLRDRNDSSKENTNIYNSVYDQFAKTEKQVRERGRKPDWNKNKPHRKYVPASERYPKGLQKQRAESKVRRQMELLYLVEKNSSNTLQVRKGNSPEKSPIPQDDVKISRPHEDVKIVQESKKEEKFQRVDSGFNRSDSPPVPAVKNRLHQAQKRTNVAPIPPVYNGNILSAQNNVSPELDKQESERPPSSQYIPYVRTKEIYYLDPDAPMSRPSTHDPQYKRTGTDQESRQIFSSDHASDPLLNPNIVRNKDRQQAILRGLSELRKGLLQKQRELETGLMPDI